MDDLVGKMIVEVRLMTKKEMATECWNNDEPVLLVLSDGTKLYPSADTEGNGPGCMFGTKNGKEFALE